MPAENAVTLLDRLAAELPAAKRQTLRRMIADGRVRVNGRRASRASQVVQAADAVTVAERAAAPDPAKLLKPLSIVFEDADILVVHKPPGLLTSTVPGEKRVTALALVRAYAEKRDPRARVGLIHRLDRDAAGLLIFSKSHAAYESLKSQFFKHTVERIYHALVHGEPRPAKGRIESNVIERADGTVRSTKQHAKGQRAITDYEVLEQRKGQAIVRVRLETGRKHQIRVHLSERGWPIVGDRVYGREKDAAPQLMLTAVRLEIDHPKSGRRMTFQIEPTPAL
jgi:23S rRNA pseudouridine1911/1915/1917 synthase